MVGILTFHRAVNYGAVLQAYALQKTLDEIGISNEVIDYRCPFIEKHYNPLPGVSPLHLKHFLKEVSLVPQKYRLRMHFDIFLSQNLKMSRVVERQNLREIITEYDTIVTGSDQIWNLAVTGGDTTYALDFAPETVRKISYAASIGPEEIEKQYQSKLAPLLKRYNVLSVREPAARRPVELLSKKKVELDVDPTVLQPIEKWDDLAEKSELDYKNFVFVYTMQPSEILFGTAEKLARKKNLKIYSLSMVDDSPKLGINVKGAKIEDFLWMIKHASYVVTNSFHGLLFAIRFHKQFYWAFQQGKHMSNPRFNMLIEQYGIDCRCCSESQKDLPMHTMDYEKVEITMKQQRNQSIAHLKNSITGEY